MTRQHIRYWGACALAAALILTALALAVRGLWSVSAATALLGTASAKCAGDRPAPKAR
jgi:hypothetical protein